MAKKRKLGLVDAAKKTFQAICNFTITVAGHFHGGHVFEAVCSRGGPKTIIPMRPSELTDGQRIMTLFQSANNNLWARSLDKTQAAEFTGFMYELTERYEDGTSKKAFRIAKMAGKQPGSSTWVLNEGRVVVNEAGEIIPQAESPFIWRGGDTTWFSTPFTINGVRNLVEAGKSLFGSNYAAFCCVLGGVGFSLHYTTNVEVTGSCPVLAVVGVPGAGKSTAAQAGLSLCGDTTSADYSAFAASEKSKQQCIPFLWDDAKKKADIGDYVMQAYGNKPRQTKSSRAETAKTVAIVVDNTLCSLYEKETSRQVLVIFDKPVPMLSGRDLLAKQAKLREAMDEASSSIHLMIRLGLLYRKAVDTDGPGCREKDVMNAIMAKLAGYLEGRALTSYTMLVYYTYQILLMSDNSVDLTDIYDYLEKEVFPVVLGERLLVDTKTTKPGGNRPSIAPKEGHKTVFDGITQAVKLSSPKKLQQFFRKITARYNPERDGADVDWPEKNIVCYAIYIEGMLKIMRTGPAKPIGQGPLQLVDAIKGIVPLHLRRKVDLAGDDSVWTGGKAGRVQRDCSLIPSAVIPDAHIFEEAHTRLMEWRKGQLLAGLPGLADNPAVVADNHAVVADNPAVVADNPAGVPDNPAVVANNPAIVADNPAVVADNPTAVPDNPAVVADNPAVVADNPAGVADNPAVVADNPAGVPDNPAVVADNPAVVANNPAGVPDNPTAVANNPAIVADNPAGVPDNPTAVPDNPAVVADKTAEAGIRDAIPSKKRKKNKVAGGSEQGTKRQPKKKKFADFVM